MILFADSGSTKTSWLLYDKNDRSRKYFETLGINPIIHHHEEIFQKVYSIAELVAVADKVEEIKFFGAGCSSPERNKLAQAALKSIFTKATIEIDHDMKAAAYAICGNEPGIACILGTGSNSIFFDGTNLVESYAGIGYILGDEASGAYFGKILLRDFLYHLLPVEMEHYLLTEYKLEKNTIFQLVYKEASPNRYLASFAPVLSKFRETDYVQVTLQRGFTEFFDFHVSCFENYQDYPIGFVGSIANSFKVELKKVADEFECHLGKFVQRPIDEIADYFISKSSQ
ncbi:MAG: N-acetylglucosamine kinase [Sphingobacteriales bacterium]|jgi:glucosamine kinase|nr:N-acetylglucosamine kinase [Sphingobacteriales bacterium]